MQTLLRTFRCPACGVQEPVASDAALARVRQAGLCQGCRARRSLERRPEVLPLFLGFWRTYRFPASAAWLDAATPTARAALLPRGRPKGEAVESFCH